MHSEGSLIPLVFQLVEPEAGVLLLLEDWEYLWTLEEATRKAETWGEFRNAISQSEWELLGLVMAPEKKFNRNTLVALLNEEYPPWLEASFSVRLSQGFVDEFSRDTQTVLCDWYSCFPTSRLEEMKSKLREEGYRVVRVAEPLWDLEV